MIATSGGLADLYQKTLQHLYYEQGFVGARDRFMKLRLGGMLQSFDIIWELPPQPIIIFFFGGGGGGHKSIETPKYLVLKGNYAKSVSGAASLPEIQKF